MHGVAAFFDTHVGVMARITLLCFLMFLSGRAALDLAITLAGYRPDEEPFDNENFVAIGFGGTTALLAMWALSTVHAFSYAAMLGALCGIVLLSAAFNPRFRAVVMRPWRQFDSTALAYGAGSVAFLISLGMNEYALRSATAIYIQQGWGLFEGISSSYDPNFGTILRMPVFYAGHLVSAVFGLLGYGNHLLYYEVGTYWVNVLISPAVLVGAYLLFRRFMGPAASAIASAAFCTITLGPKIWSLRGEPIGWIVGFAFLMTLIDLVSALREGKDARRIMRLAIVPALLLFGTMMTHGIAAMTAVFAVAFGIRFIVTNWNRTRIQDLFKFAAVAIACVVALLILFTSTYAHSSLIEKHSKLPAGGPDAAIQYNSAWNGAPIDDDVPVVKAKPPYVPIPQMVAITAITPPLAIFDRSYDDFQLRDFPGLGVDELNALPYAVKIGIPGVLLIFAGLYLSRAIRSKNPALQSLFWISLTIYAAVIIIGVIADMKSVALYPVAAVRRSYVYCEFFYWLALAAAGGDVVSAWGGAWWDRTAGVLRIPALARYWKAIVATGFLFGWFAVSQSVFMQRATPGLFFDHLEARLAGILLNRQSAGAEDVSEVLKPLYDAITFIREHTKPGEWVYTNVISSDNTFAYLTDGRYAVLEGPSIYQQFFKLRASAARIRRYSEVALSGDPGVLRADHVRYVMLYTHTTCRLENCYGNNTYNTDFAMFDSSPAYRRVFKNQYYAIYKVTGAPAPAKARAIGDALNHCETSVGRTEVRIAACDKLVGYFKGLDPGELDPNIFLYRGIAYLQRKQYNRAIDDFNRAVVVEPGSGAPYYQRALALAAIGEVPDAISDLRIAQAFSDHIEADRAEIRNLRRNKGRGERMAYVKK